MNGASLRQWRASRQFTQEQAADWLAISPRHYQRLEAGDRPILGAVLRLLERDAINA